MGSAKSERNHRKTGSVPKKRRRSSGGGANRANGRPAVVRFVEGTSQEDLATEAAEVTGKRKDLKKRRRSSGGGAKRAYGRREDVGSVEVEGTSQDLAAEAAEVTRKPPKKRMSVLAKKKMRGIQRRKRKREKAERFVQKYPPVFSDEFRLLAGDFRRFYLLVSHSSIFLLSYVLIQLYKFLL